MQFAARRLRTVGAEAGTGRHPIGAFVFPTLRFELQHRPTCPMDRAGQIFLIIHDTHPLIRCAERHAGTFQWSFSLLFATKTTFLYNSLICEHHVKAMTRITLLDASARLAGQRVPLSPQGGKFARTLYPLTREPPPGDNKGGGLFSTSKRNNTQRIRAVQPRSQPNLTVS